MKLRKVRFPVLIIAISLLAIVFTSSCADDGSSVFDPLGQIHRAFELASALVESDPEVFAFARLVGIATPDNVNLDQKSFAWTYEFQVIEDPTDLASGYKRIRVTIEPAESAEITCEGSFGECAYGDTYMLQESDFADVTLGLSGMITLVSSTLTTDVKAITIFQDLHPDAHYVAYYLLDEFNQLILIINAETGQIMSDPRAPASGGIPEEEIITW